MAVPLPSPESLGLVTPQATQQPAQFGGVGEALAERAGAVSQLGAATAQVGGEFMDAQDRVNFAAANSSFLQRKLALDQQFDQDTDYATKAQRYSQAISQAANDSAAPIRSAQLRSDFLDRTMRWQEYGIEAMQRQAHANATDADRAYLNTSIDTTLNAATATTDANMKRSLLDSIPQQIDAMAAKGSITQVEAAKLKQSVPNLYAERYFKTLTDTDPALAARLLLPGAPALAPGLPTDTAVAIHKAALAVPGTDEEALARTAQLEGGSARSTNPVSGAAGPFQFMPATARAYGVADPRDPEASAIGAAKLQMDNRSALSDALGRDPTGAELYLAHQQGAAGAAALIRNPDAQAVAALAPVYGSMAAARAAVVNNGGTPTMKAGDFVTGWANRYNGETAHAPGATPAPTTDATGNAVYPKTGDIRDFLRPDQRAALSDVAMNRAQAWDRARDVDAARQEALLAKQQKQASDAAEDRVIQDVTGPDGAKLTAGMIADPHGPYKDLQPTAKLRMIDFLRQQDRGEPLPQVSHQTAISLMSDLRAGKLADMAPIYDAYNAGRLSNADFGFVQNQFKELQTNDGQELNQSQQRFLQAVKPSIDKSNPLMGQLDMSGGSQFFRLQQDVAGKVADYRKAGKDPHDLFNPSKPDFVGSAEALAPYQTSIPESLQHFSERMQAQQAAAKPKPKASNPPLAQQDEGSKAGDTETGPPIYDPMTGFLIPGVPARANRPTLDQIFGR